MTSDGANKYVLHSEEKLNLFFMGSKNIILKITWLSLIDHHDQSSVMIIIDRSSTTDMRDDRTRSETCSMQTMIVIFVTMLLAVVRYLEARLQLSRGIPCRTPYLLIFISVT